MPRLSKKTMFAIEAVLDVAFHVGENPVRSGDITQRQRIPKRYLEQVLQHLVRAGILSGRRGPRGGYRLGRDRSRITLDEVVWPMWEQLREEMRTQLDAITIDDLCKRASAKGLDRPPAKKPQSAAA